MAFANGVVEGGLFEGVDGGGNFDAVLDEDLDHAERDVFGLDLGCTVQCVLVETWPIRSQSTNIDPLREVQHLLNLSLLHRLKERPAHLLLHRRHHFVSLVGHNFLLVRGCV